MKVQELIVVRSLLFVLLLPVSVAADSVDGSLIVGSNQSGNITTSVAADSDWYHLDALEWALIGATTADIITIEVVMRRGGYEQNPLMQSRAARIGFNAGQTALLIYLSRRLAATGRDKSAKAILLVPTIGHGAAAGWSAHVAYRLQW